ncbi:MAG: hypothetical protein CSA62_14840 [Planctomycetota bacterium]|nr:MAG: hypothetical protein CSA62_14840 [Planctomycetota bacterium]
MLKRLRLISVIGVLAAVPLSAQGSSAQGSSAQERPKAEKAEKAEAGKKPEAIELLLEKRPEIPTDNRGGRIVKLSLQDCLRLGSEANIDLRINALLERIAREDSIAAQGQFDTEFFLDGSWRRVESPARSSIQPSSVVKTYGGKIGFRKKFMSGLVAELSYGPQYTEQKVNSSFAFPDDFFSGSLGLSLRQPLLRGAWWDYHGAEIEKAKHEYAARGYEYQRNQQMILQSIATAYYELAFARENWGVRYFSLELARERLRNTESRIRFGGLAARDRIAHEAEVARKQEELILAETTILDAEDALRRLVMGFRSEKDWDLVIVTTVDLKKGDPKIDLPTWREAALVARKNRPDALALMRRVQGAKLNEMVADKNLLPQLDLSAGYSSAAQRDNFGELNSDFWEGEYPSYNVQLQFSVPLGNRVARSRYEKARLEVRRLMTQLSILHIDIIREVRDAIRRLERLEKSIKAAEESVRLARNNLEAEQIKLRHDSSIQFEVQERANELSAAASRLIRARFDYRHAWFQLLAVQGRLTEFSRLPEPAASDEDEKSEKGQDK